MNDSFLVLFADGVEVGQTSSTQYISFFGVKRRSFWFSSAIQRMEFHLFEFFFFSGCWWGLIIVYTFLLLKLLPCVVRTRISQVISKILVFSKASVTGLDAFCAITTWIACFV